MKLNENKIQLSGKANIPCGLELSKDYDLTIANAEVRSSQDNPNDDGTFDRVYKLLITERSEIQIIGQGKAIPARKKGSQSQVLRNVLRTEWEQQFSGEVDFERYYEEQMSKIIEERKNNLI